MTTYHLYNTLIGGLSKKSFTTEKSAGWNALNAHDNHPAFEAVVDEFTGEITKPALEIDDNQRFVKIIAFDRPLTESEIAEWKPAFEDAWS